MINYNNYYNKITQAKVTKEVRQSSGDGRDPLQKPEIYGFTSTSMAEKSLQYRLVVSDSAVGVAD